MRINTHIDSKIRVELAALPDGVGMMMAQAMTIPNQVKLAAQKQRQWGWQQMPDTIDLWSIEGDHLILPRGFMDQYEEGLKLMGHEVRWIDHRTNGPRLPDIGLVHTPTFHDEWQIPAIEAILLNKQGIYKAPAGSGKTVSVLRAIEAINEKSLIIINTKDIMWQWQQRVADHLGEQVPVGQIGDGVMDISPYITIATAQTLHSRYEDLLKQGFFEQFSFVCLDECHHATADTYNRLMNSFTALYRVGVSATPDKTGDFALATHVLGPVFHETTPSEVKNLIKPVVVQVPTDFFFPFRSAHGARPSNYGQMISALVEDVNRNDLILGRIWANRGHHQLVISKRLGHLAYLRERLEELGFDDPIVTITGQDDNEGRKKAKELAETSPCVLLSTLADEAMDIPRLDRLHLTFPQRNSGLVTQQVGRVERQHPDKENAFIYDYADIKVGPLKKQWQIRRREVYGPRGYKVGRT